MKKQILNILLNIVLLIITFYMSYSIIIKSEHINELEKIILSDNRILAFISLNVFILINLGQLSERIHNIRKEKKINSTKLDTK